MGKGDGSGLNAEEVGGGFGKYSLEIRFVPLGDEAIVVISWKNGLTEEEVMAGVETEKYFSKIPFSIVCNRRVTWDFAALKFISENPEEPDGEE